MSLHSAVGVLSENERIKKKQQERPNERMNEWTNKKQTASRHCCWIRNCLFVISLTLGLLISHFDHSIFHSKLKQILYTKKKRLSVLSRLAVLWCSHSVSWSEEYGSLESKIIFFFFQQEIRSKRNDKIQTNIVSNVDRLTFVFFFDISILSKTSKNEVVSLDEWRYVCANIVKWNIHAIQISFIVWPHNEIAFKLHHK